MGQIKAVPAKELKTEDGRVIPMTPGPCLWCGRHVEVGREEAGSTDPFDPAWQADGDYGCPSAPEAVHPFSESHPDSTCGDHARPYDLARAILRPDTRAARREALGCARSALVAHLVGITENAPRWAMQGAIERIDNLLKELES